eukprot:13462290-Alexandrium_andersonii.AAC.1
MRCCLEQLFGLNRAPGLRSLRCRGNAIMLLESIGQQGPAGPIAKLTLPLALASALAGMGLQGPTPCQATHELDVLLAYVLGLGDQARQGQ